MGGMGVLCKNIVQNLTKDKYNVTIVGTKQEDLSYSFGRYKQVNSLNLMVGQTDPIIFQLLNQMAYVDQVDVKPDVVHCFDWSTFGAGLYLKRKYGCKLICSIQLALSDITERTNPLQQISFDHGRALEMQGLAEANVVIQVSSHYAKKFFLFGGKTVVINNGINTTEFLSHEKIALPGDNRKKLLYMGRYAEMKNTHVLSSITLPAGVDLLFAGNDRGSDPQVWDLTQNNIKNNKNMYYIGEYYGQDKVNLLHSVDGVIFPSLREPFGIVGLEAIASGAVLLASNVDGMRDYLNDTNHITCGTTVESMQNTIQAFLSLDNEQIQQYKRNGLETCKQLEWSIQTEKYEEVYDFLVK